MITYRTYFQKWAAAPETYEAYDVGWTELARSLDAQPSVTDTVYLIPGYTWFSVYSWQYSFGYLYQGTTPTQMVSVGAFNLAPTIESTLAAMENITTVKFVDWDNDIVGGDANAEEQLFFFLASMDVTRVARRAPAFKSATIRTSPWTAPGQSMNIWSR